MITKQQALTANEFHYGTCTVITGPRGGKDTRIEHWRRNGETKTWKTRPDEFRVPIKYGMRSCSYLTNWNAGDFHTEADCPLNH
jgi:hypothetical protein